MKRAFVRALFTLLALLAARPAAAAGGRHRHRPCPQRAGQPRAAVLVRIEALSAGASTAADGMYRLVIPWARIRAATTA